MSDRGLELALCRRISSGHLTRNFAQDPAAPIHCPDGFRVSVQAGQHLYCKPRQASGPWSEVECGFPSEEPPEWKEYSEGTGVYGFVPIGLVVDVLVQHGWQPDTSTEDVQP